MIFSWTIGLSSKSYGETVDGMLIQSDFRYPEVSATRSELAHFGDVCKVSQFSRLIFRQHTANAAFDVL